jgi:hypothetical protein
MTSRYAVIQAKRPQSPILSLKPMSAGEAQTPRGLLSLGRRDSKRRDLSVDQLERMLAGLVLRGLDEEFLLAVEMNPPTL